MSNKISNSNKDARNLKESNNEQLQSEIQRIGQSLSKLQAYTKHNFELDSNKIQDNNKRLKNLEQKVRKNYFFLQDFCEETDRKITTLCVKMENMIQLCEEMEEEIKFIKTETDYLRKEIKKQICKENPFKTPFIEGLNEQIQTACEEFSWENCINYLKKYLNKSSEAYRQLKYVNTYESLPQYAARLGYTEIIKVLVKNGLNVNETNGLLARNHMLHHAAGHGQNKVVNFLIQKGAILDERDAFGYTPLHYASLSGHLDTVKLLCEKGANVNVCASDLYTPLLLAESCGHTSVVKYIKELKRKQCNISTIMYFNIFVGVSVLYYCFIYLPKSLQKPSYWW